MKTRPFYPAMAVVVLAGPAAPAQILYVSSLNGPIVSRIPAPFTVSTYATGFNSARGLAIDNAGNLYVANGVPGTISIVPPGGGPAQPFATGFDQPQGVALGFDGFLYVASGIDNSVRRVSLSGGAATPFASGFNGRNRSPL